MDCPKCGAHNDDAAAFCSSCGVKIDSVHEEPSGAPLTPLEGTGMDAGTVDTVDDVDGPRPDADPLLDDLSSQVLQDPSDDAEGTSAPHAGQAASEEEVREVPSLWQPTDGEDLTFGQFTGQIPAVEEPLSAQAEETDFRAEAPFIGFGSLWYPTDEGDLPFGETTGEIPSVDEPTGPHPVVSAASDVRRPAERLASEIPQVEQAEKNRAYPSRRVTAAPPMPRESGQDVPEDGADEVTADGLTTQMPVVPQRSVEVATGEQVPIQEPYYVQQASGEHPVTTRDAVFPQQTAQPEGERNYAQQPVYMQTSGKRPYVQQQVAAQQPVAKSYMQQPLSPSHPVAGQRYIKESILKRSWMSLIKSPEWFMRVALLGLVSLIPIFGPIAVIGYIYSQARSTAFGVEEPLPEKVLVGRTIRAGLRVFLISLVFGLVLCLIFQPVSQIPYVGIVLTVVIDLLFLPCVVACCFRTAVCEKIGSGFNLQYSFRLLKGKYGQALEVTALPTLLAIAAAAAMTFIWVLISVVMVGTSLNSITMFRYNAVEQLTAISPAIYAMVILFLVVALWFIFTASAVASIVATRAFAYLCSPLEAALWPDFESAWVPTMARDTVGGPDASRSTAEQPVWSSRPTTEAYIQSQPTVQIDPVMQGPDDGVAEDDADTQDMDNRAFRASSAVQDESDLTARLAGVPEDDADLTVPISPALTGIDGISQPDIVVDHDDGFTGQMDANEGGLTAPMDSAQEDAGFAARMPEVPQGSDGTRRPFVWRLPFGRQSTAPIQPAVREGISVGATAKVALVDARSGGAIALGRFPVIIGKGKGASLQLEVSGTEDRLFACITEDPDGGFRLEALGPGGMTFINGFDLDEHEDRKLSEGDILAFGAAEYTFKVL